MLRDDHDVLDIGLVELIPRKFTTIEYGCLLLAQAPVRKTPKFIPLETASETCEVTVIVRLPEGLDGS
ncbi:MAG: hypothetical protein IPJ98_02355 [Bryobacterales bacterium]|nr:hypothetical protein [Bryobacterales bacterium]